MPEGNALSPHVSSCAINCAAFEEARKVDSLEQLAYDGKTKCSYILNQLECLQVRSVLDMSVASTDGEFLLSVRDNDFFHTAVGVVSSDVEARDVIRRSKQTRWLPSRQRPRQNKLNLHVIKWDIQSTETMPRVKTDAVVLIDELQRNDDDIANSVFPNIIFNVLNPDTVLITTPNAQYNKIWNLTGKRDGRNHKEYLPHQFEGWSLEMARRYGYRIAECSGFGNPPVDQSDAGWCTLMLVMVKSRSSILWSPTLTLADKSTSSAMIFDEGNEDGDVISVTVFDCEITSK